MKTVLISGGTFGLGREIALGLARSGYNVIAFGLDSKQPASLAQNSIQAMRSEAEQELLPLQVLEADVTREQDIAAVVDCALSHYGRIDAVVNNAAIGPLGKATDTEPNLWDRVLAVNLKGPYLLARAIVPYLQQQNGGSIINVGSGAGWGKANMLAYAASKGGLIAFNAAMALDYFADRIRVNMVIPGGGGIAGGMSLGRNQEYGQGVAQPYIGSVAGRAVNGEDMMATIRFLLSDEAQAISGTIIDIGCFFHQGSSTPPGVKL